jgi:chorismate synthase
LKNTFGNNLSVTLFGESHGDAIGCVIDGISPGIKVDHDFIKKCLEQRAARSDIATARKEDDEPIFLSGIKNGYTEGTPIAIIIKNACHSSSDYSELENTPRPSHADLCAEYKYHGYQDKNGGGHFSGRLTAPLVAAGALIRAALIKKGIYIGTHISTLHGIKDAEFEDFRGDVEKLSSAEFPTLSDAAAELMKDEIMRAKSEKDSVGGTLECAVIGMPAGIGDPIFDGIENRISAAVFGIPAIKGIEFGARFESARMLGSENNDDFISVDGKISTVTNNHGGILGGISSGMPIVFRCAVKPTPSIYKEQNTVSLSENRDTKIKIEGRHDPAIIHRVRAVVDAALAIAVADMLTVRFGTDFLANSN